MLIYEDRPVTTSPSIHCSVDIFEDSVTIATALAWFICKLFIILGQLSQLSDQLSHTDIEKYDAFAYDQR